MKRSAWSVTGRSQETRLRRKDKRHPMNHTETNHRRRWAAGLALVISALALTPTATFAQAKEGPSVPMSVILFPAVVSTADGAAPAEPTPAARTAQESVTDSLRRSLTRSGVGVIVYNRRLPSIQRAVSEGVLRAEDAAAGPGDDPRKAQRLAEIIGATDFITATIDDYKWDSAARMATFNVSVFRNAASDGSPLGTAAAPGKGEAPADVAPSRQEGSATARAADAAAEQAVQGLFPRAPEPAPGEQEKKASMPEKSKAESYILPGLGLILGILVLSGS